MYTAVIGPCMAWALCFAMACSSPLTATNLRTWPDEALWPTPYRLTDDFSSALTPEARARFVEPPSVGTREEAPSPPVVEEVVHVMARLAGREWFYGRPIPISQIRNDCQYRAHLVAMEILSSHPTWPVGKVFARGNLETAGGLVHWGFHVATYVVVREGGRDAVVVVDPSFSTRPIPLATWLSTMTRAGDASPPTLRLYGATILEEPDAAEDKPRPTDDDALRGELFESLRTSLRLLLARAVPERATRRQLRVIGPVDGPEVRFEEDGRTTGWFWMRDGEGREALARALAASRPVTIDYERVPLGLLRGEFLFITGVHVE